MFNTEIGVAVVAIVHGQLKFFSVPGRDLLQHGLKVGDIMLRVLSENPKALLRPKQQIFFHIVIPMPCVSYSLSFSKLYFVETDDGLVLFLFGYIARNITGKQHLVVFVVDGVFLGQNDSSFACMGD